MMIVGIAVVVVVFIVVVMHHGHCRRRGVNATFWGRFMASADTSKASLENSLIMWMNKVKGQGVQGSDVAEDSSSAATAPHA